MLSKEAVKFIFELKFDKHISFIVACTKFGLLLPLLTANAELYLFVSLTTWFFAGYIESRYTQLKFEKKKFILIFFIIKPHLSGIKTYIEELVQGANKYGRKDVEYIFSHDIEKLKNRQFFINSKYRLVRWVFQLRYLVWKQIILPIKLLFNSADVLICPDYVAPIFSPTRKIVVIHDNLFWKYPFNYPMLWRNYFIKLIKLGVSSNCEIVTTSKYSKNGLKNIFNNKISYIYQSSERVYL